MDYNEMQQTPSHLVEESPCLLASYHLSEESRGQQQSADQLTETARHVVWVCSCSATSSAAVYCGPPADCQPALDSQE